MGKTFVIALLVAAGLSTPAAADWVVERSDGSYICFGPLVWPGLLIVVAVVLGLVADALGSSGRRPRPERGEPRFIHDDNQAARTRAVQQILDADSRFAEDYFDAVRARASTDRVRAGDVVARPTRLGR